MSSGGRARVTPDDLDRWLSEGTISASDYANIRSASATNLFKEITELEEKGLLTAEQAANLQLRYLPDEVSKWHDAGIIEDWQYIEITRTLPTDADEFIKLIEVRDLVDPGTLRAIRKDLEMKKQAADDGVIDWDHDTTASPEPGALKVEQGPQDVKPAGSRASTAAPAPVKFRPKAKAEGSKTETPKVVWDLSETIDTVKKAAQKKRDREPLSFRKFMAILLSITSGILFPKSLSVGGLQKFGRGGWLKMMFPPKVKAAISPLKRSKTRVKRSLLITRACSLPPVFSGE